ncbi:MAG: mechanosensitive ion channel family protein [Planctomycetota bacterium]
MRRFLTSLSVLFLLSAAAPLPALPGPCQEEQAKTLPAQGDAWAVDKAALELQLEPMRKAGLGVEAEAWAGALQAKVGEITQLGIEKLGANEERKQQIDDALSTLQEQKTKLIDRLGVVLAAWKAKGGDPAELETYMAQVGGVKVDVTDTWSAGRTILNWLKSEEGGIRLGKNIGFFLLILLLARILAGILGRVVDKALSRLRKTPELLRNFMVNTTRKITFFIGLVVALGQLEVDIAPFLAAIGAAGFVIGFALQGTLSNFASGIMILLYRPYDIGDVVTVSGETGKVTAMTLVSTTITKPDNQVTVIPNGSIWGNVITNITGSTTRRVDMVFGIGYGDDIAKAQGVLERILQEHPKVLADPAPVVKVGALADSSVNFLVRPWAATGDYWDVFWDVTRQVKERFDAEGISIPFPQRDVHLHQAT